jgi:hypothetical protein
MCIILLYIMQDLFEDLGINETFTKQLPKQKKFNKIKMNIPQREDYNMMADLLELPMTKKKERYLFVIVDLFSNEFDIEPLTNKDPKSVLESMKKCFKRSFINKPYATLRTDGGSEFKGVFHKYLFDESILHKTALANRHKQLANVEALNKQLGRVFNGYMNMKEKKTGEKYMEWTDIIGKVRIKLNKIRKNTTILEIPFLPQNKKAKYNIGDFVYEKLDWPEDALGKKQPTSSFRTGDNRFSEIAKKIIIINPFPDEPYFRYVLEGMTNVSYSESELMKSDETESKFKVKQIINKRKVKNKLEYKVWFDKELKKSAVWLPKTQLIQDGLIEYIKEYEKANKK